LRTTKKIKAKKRREKGGLSTSDWERGKSRDGKCSAAVVPTNRAFSQAGGEGEGVSGVVSVEDGGGFSAGGGGSCGGRG
jgi:hypothetical protein